MNDERRKKTVLYYTFPVCNRGISVDRSVLLKCVLIVDRFTNVYSKYILPQLKSSKYNFRLNNLNIF